MGPELNNAVRIIIIMNILDFWNSLPDAAGCGMTDFLVFGVLFEGLGFLGFPGSRARLRPPRNGCFSGRRAGFRRGFWLGSIPIDVAVARGKQLFRLAQSP